MNRRTVPARPGVSPQGARAICENGPTTKDGPNGCANTKRPALADDWSVD